MYVAAGDPVRSHAGQPGGICGERWTKIACRTLINWSTRHVGAGDGEDLGIFGCCLSVFLQRSLPARSHRFQTPHHRFPQSGRSVQILSEEHPGMIWVCFGCQHAWGALEVLIWVTPGTVTESTALILPLQRCTFASSSHPSPVGELTNALLRYHHLSLADW